MSGIDEQCLIECPNCHYEPSYWIFGSSVSGGLAWLFSENYSGSLYKRGTISLTKRSKIKNVDELESRMDYVWCTNCLRSIEDEAFIESMLKRAKALEIRGRVVFI